MDQTNALTKKGLSREGVCHCPDPCGQCAECYSQGKCKACFEMGNFDWPMHAGGSKPCIPFGKALVQRLKRVAIYDDRDSWLVAFHFTPRLNGNLKYEKPG